MKTRSIKLITKSSLNKYHVLRNVLLRQCGNNLIGAAFFTIALALFGSLASAQTNNTPSHIVWQKSLGGSDDDVANCIKPTLDGGFIIAGTCRSNDGNITGNHGLNDICLIKLNATGDLQWQHSYGGSGVDEAVSVVVTLDGGFAIGGRSSSHDGDITGNHGSSDFYLIKTNEEGTIQWQKSYGGSLPDNANSMEPTSDNGFVITGTSYSNDGDVSGNHGMGDACIIKVDQNGSLEWGKTVGGSSLEVINDIKQTADDGYIITGYTLSDNGDISIYKGEEDFLFFKLDANGNLEWLKTMGGTGGDCGSAAVQTTDGGYALCGLTHSRDLDVIDHINGHDIWIIKTNSSGEAQWTHCMGGSGPDNGFDIKQQTDGALIVTGYTGSNDYDVSGLHGLHDIWLAALDTAKNLLWQKTLGGTKYDYPRNLQIISNGDYIIAGKSNSNDGDVTENHGGYDFWVSKVSVCNSVFYKDEDRDGYGDLNSTVNACNAPYGYVADHTDCNDRNATVNPDVGDICNNIDDNCNGAIDENAIVASISPGGSVSICKTTKLTLSANDRSGIGYQWIKNDVEISGATNQTYRASGAGQFKVSESNSFGCSSVSAVTTITVIVNPNATITPLNSLDICNTDSVVLRANGNKGLTYQWQKDGGNVSGATNKNYTATALGTFKVIVTNSSGCSKTSEGTVVTKSCRENSVISATVELSLHPNPTAGQFIIDLMAEDISASTATIEVFSEIGQRIYNKVVPVNEGNLHQEVQLQSGIAGGIYLVKVVANGKVYSGQIIYQK